MSAVAGAIWHRWFLILAHRTGRADFRHPALRLVSPRDSRRTTVPQALWARQVSSFVFRYSFLRRTRIVVGVCRHIANHRHLAIFESTPEVRVLSSAGVTRPQQSYDPVRLPPMPPPEATLRSLPSHQTGLPRLLGLPFRRAVPTTPADQTGACVDCFPAHAAFPKWQEGRHPHCHFRGLLRLHSRYGPPDRSAAQGDLCHEAPAQPVTRLGRSSASESIDNSPDGIFLH